MRPFFFLLAASGLLAAACNLGKPSPASSPFPTSEEGRGTPPQRPTRQLSTPASTSPNDYVTFSINVQDFSYPEQSADALRKIIILHERYQVPVDIYLTSTMVALYEALAPDLLDFLRESEVVAVSYHVRPPKPFAREYDWLGLSQDSPARQYETILGYETHGLDLRTGLPTDSPGGYQRLSDLMGYPPYIAASLNQDLAQIVNHVFQDLGARFTIVHGRSVNLGEVQDGLYVKPEHAELRLYEYPGQDVGSAIQAALGEAHASPTARPPYFVSVKMHDNDFFASNAAFATVYLTQRRQPPWDVDRKAELLSPDEQQSVWALYESAVAFVDSQRTRLTPVNAPALLALEEQTNVGALPPSHPSASATVSPSSAPDRAHWTEGTVYLTIVSHNEEPSNQRPDYLRDAEYYRENRQLIVQLVEMIGSHNAAYNFQSDWNFLQAVAHHDIPEVTSDTGGLNLLRWMAELQGVEIDPHAHETKYNYADVAYLIQQLGVPPSNTVGGFLYEPPDNPQGWEQHRDGLVGNVYPAYSWQADILWGASTFLHQASDDHTSGAWIPQDRFNFYQHDPTQSLIYLGGCTGDEEGVLALVDAIQSDEAPPGGFFTASIMLVQDFLTSEGIRELEEFIIQVEPKVREGAIQWAHLNEIATMWQLDYQAKPFQYPCVE